MLSMLEEQQGGQCDQSVVASRRGTRNEVIELEWGQIAQHFSAVRGLGFIPGEVRRH